MQWRKIHWKHSEIPRWHPNSQNTLQHWQMEVRRSRTQETRSQVVINWYFFIKLLLVEVSFSAIVNRFSPKVFHDEGTILQKLLRKGTFPAGVLLKGMTQGTQLTTLLPTCHYEEITHLFSFTATENKQNKRWHYSFNSSLGF